MNQSHWTTQKERGSLLGLKFLFFLHRCFGKVIFKIFLYPVMVYFYFTGTKARTASKGYLSRVQKHFAKDKEESSFKHFMQFADAILDKLQSWSSESSVNVKVLEPELWKEIRKNEMGAIFLGAHLGNLDACRNQSNDIMGGSLNALMLTEHASKFIKLAKMQSPELEQQIINVESVGPDTAILLQDKLLRHEHIFILADRIPQEGAAKVSTQSFLGEAAQFGTGPFVLASILKVPVYFISAFKFDQDYHLHISKLETSLTVGRKERNNAIETAIAEYAGWLEKQCEKAPLQWYNFYPFWQEAAKNN